MEIIHFWIIKLTLTWIILSVDCNSLDKSKHFIENELPKNTEFIRYDISPLTHMELGMDKRSRRDSEFDRGYDEFLRNYYNDDSIKRRGRYKVRESEESDSAENSDTSNEDNDDDNDGASESNESEENRKKFKSKPSKSSGRRPIKKAEKKTKQCKTEKRGNMQCNVCFNPINDEKTESCSYNSDPKGKNYEYSQDSSFRNRDKKPESLEEEDDNDDENEESTETSEKDAKKNKPPINKETANKPPVNKPPGNHKQQHPPRFYPPYNGPRRFPNQNYGPQLFLPQSFQPISVPGGGRRPIRIHINNSPLAVPPPPVAIIRYRTAESPFGSQHVRLITYPNNPSPYPPPQYRQNRPAPQSNYQSAPLNSNRRPVSASQEQRPPRDINGAHSESFLLNVTKDQPYENLRMPSDHGAHREYSSFMSKDGSMCKKSTENGQVCFECYVKGERRRECMFANTHRPDNFYKSYSTSKKYSTNHPYVFEMPAPFVSKHSKYNTKSHSNKNKGYSAEQFGGFSGTGGVSDERFGDLKLVKYEKNPNASYAWDFNHNHNNKQVRPQPQPLRSSSAEIIYGKSRPGPDSLALFFQMDPKVFNEIMTDNNQTNSDENKNSTSKKTIKEASTESNKVTSVETKKATTRGTIKASSKEINKATSKEISKVNNKATRNEKSTK